MADYPDTPQGAVCRWVARIMSYGAGNPDPELDGMTIGEVASRVMTAAGVATDPVGVHRKAECPWCQEEAKEG